MNTIVSVLVLVSLALVAGRAPIHNLDSKTIIPNQYIVVFHKNSSVEIRDFHVAKLQSEFWAGTTLLNTFSIDEFIGYSALLDKDALASVAESPSVSYIEADQVVHIIEDPVVVQSGATWGIDRIDQEKLPLDGDYHYYQSGGRGVYAYVIDTGIQTSHKEFVGRAVFGASFTGETIQDGNGHGTHVAGTIAGTVYGVAKQSTVVAVQVLSASGSGAWSWVIGGIDWVTAHHKSRGTSARSVANLSLGGGVSQAVDDAVTASVSAGVVHSIAAGNSNANACNYSPARTPTAITVGATTSNDLRATFSNFGSCVDIFAPGQAITAAWIGVSNDAINTISGTSMAAPHVAGAVAMYLGNLYHENSESAVPPPSVVVNFLTTRGTKDTIPNPGTGSPNILLYSPYTKA